MEKIQFVTVSIVLINEALCTTMMFPFVGLLVSFLDPSIDRSTAGYYSGLLLGAFQGAQSLFCPTWGKISDVVGRKPVFLFGLLCGAVCVVLLGLSTNLWMALVFRCLHGMFAANAPIAKTYIAEATDRTQQARAFGMLSVTWAAGTFVGPMIGGLLYDLHCNNPLCLPFNAFPALAPCLVVSAYSVVAAILVCFYLPESNPRAIPVTTWARQTWNSRTSPTFAVTPIDNRSKGPETMCIPEDTRWDTASEELFEHYIVNDEAMSDIQVEVSQQQQQQQQNQQSQQCGCATSGIAKSLPSLSWSQLFAHPTLGICVPMYMTYCAYNIVFTEVMPLYGIAYSRDGGLELTARDVGIFFSINAGVSVMMNLLFPLATAKIPLLTLWRIAAAVFSVSVMCYGLATLLNSVHSVALTLAYLGFVSFFRCAASTWSSSLSLMFVTNAAPPEHLGRVTGMAHSCGSAMRALFPTLAAPLFAWSVSAPHPFPFNHFFTFLLCALLALVGYGLSTRLSEDQVTKKVCT